MERSDLFTGRQQGYHLYRIPAWLHGLAAGFLKPFHSKSTKIAAYRNIFAVRENERHLVIKNGPIVDGLRQLPSFQNWSQTAFNDPDRLEFAICKFDLSSTLANNMLPCYDAGSMRASHELRTPFLSHELLETVASYDPRSFLAFGQKSVLRRLLKRYLPTELVDRPKQGFRFPGDQFLRGYDSRTPQLAGLPSPLMETIWNSRFVPGWQRLALRAAIWREFASWYASTEKGAT